MTLTLTSEQVAVVSHTMGPALVFAVAGAGKTTAMVHRIEQLVREGHFAAGRIVASSFNRAAVDVLKQRLSVWPQCQAVQCFTLHGLGWRVLKRAIQQGLLPPTTQLPQDEQRTQQIYWETLRQARQMPELAAQLPALDKDDFLDYVSRCKGNLQFAHLADMSLPAAAQAWAVQAEAPDALPHYLKLYQLYEEIRQRQQLLTFDDLLSETWRLFWQSPQLLAAFQRQYDCLLVDEFQDVNLAQSEILDLLSQPHRNYMAIGDDDQTIYAWRGASPDFILNFCARYQAREYLLQGNFRSQASQIVLANAVIAQNQQRRSKQLQLTQGFGGSSTLHSCSDNAALAAQALQLIQAALAEGEALQEIAVLVRNWSQTPLLEHQLLQHQVPYTLPGNQYFFQRPEIKDLLAYLELAQLEWQLQGHQPLSAEQQQQWQQLWQRVHNRPNRYITGPLSQQIMTQVQDQGQSLCQVLSTLAAGCPADKSYLQTHLHNLGQQLQQLVQAWQAAAPAAETLSHLVQALDYCGWLCRQSAQPEAGQEKAENVKAFLAFCQDQGSLQALLQTLAQLSHPPARQHSAETLTLSTIHSAKGLEWQRVIVLGVQEGLLPRFQLRPAEQEAERRLLYVAMTRARQHLHLLSVPPVSSFLSTIRAENLLQQLRQLTAWLAGSGAFQEPEKAWSWPSLNQMLQIIGTLQLSSYFQQQALLPAEGLRRLQGWIAWKQAQQQKLPAAAAVFAPEQAAAESLLNAAELAELAARYVNKPQLQADQVYHPEYGLGEVLRYIQTGATRRVVIKFARRGKMQLAANDAELEWGKR